MSDYYYRFVVSGSEFYNFKVDQVQLNMTLDIKTTRTPSTTTTTVIVVFRIDGPEQLQ